MLRQLCFWFFFCVFLSLSNFDTSFDLNFYKIGSYVTTIALNVVLLFSPENIYMVYIQWISQSLISHGCSRGRGDMGSVERILQVALIKEELWFPWSNTSLVIRCDITPFFKYMKEPFLGLPSYQWSQSIKKRIQTRKSERELVRYLRKTRRKRNWKPHSFFVS